MSDRDERTRDRTEIRRNVANNSHDSIGADGPDTASWLVAGQLEEIARAICNLAETLDAVGSHL